MLQDSNLDVRFWVDAISAASYLRNRSSISAISSMTLEDAWMDKNMELRHLRIFGCEAYKHILKELRRELPNQKNIS
jgi:hypothetical protein